MITKFERKVIAGATAAVMSLSMIFAVPVSVYAENEQSQGAEALWTESEEVAEENSELPKRGVAEEMPNIEVTEEIPNIEVTEETPKKAVVDNAGKKDGKEGQTEEEIPNIKPHNSGYGEIEKSTEEVENEKQTIPVEVGQIYITDMDDSEDIIYTFTPKETSKYRFQSEQNVQFYIIQSEDSDTDVKRSGIVDVSVVLEAGETYNIRLKKEDSDQVKWNITKAGNKSVSESVEYTMSEDETTICDFIPTKSGEYMLSSKENGTVQIYDDAWKPVEGYTIEKAFSVKNEFGIIAPLEKGKTYHIDIAAAEEVIKWKIESLKKQGDYTYRVLADNTVEILRYSGTESNLIIPDKIEDRIVGSIGYGAFAKNESLVGITIPSKVTELQYAAFDHCTNLEKVTFAEGSKLKKIGHGAFYTCLKLNNVTLPDSVEKIGYVGFAHCLNLKELDLGNGVKELESYSLYANGLTKIRIPDSVINVGNYVFQDCNSLSEVTLGKGMEGIAPNMFDGCESIKQITIPKNIKYISTRAFRRTGLTSIEIPDSVESIGTLSFYECEALKKVDIGNGLAYIAEDAFALSGLTDIVWGDKIKTIGSGAFAKIESLTSISIPNNVTEIEYVAFTGCTNLRDIEIPDSVEAIGMHAFEGHEPTKSEDTAWYEAQEDGDVYAGKVYYKYKGEIPAGTIITIKEGAKGIAGGAFHMQRNLVGVEIPNSVNNIGDVAFLGCEAMKTVTIPETVKEIGDYAFGYLKAEDYYGLGYKVEGFTIRGVAGSAAEAYAKENGFNFEAIAPDYVKGDLTGDDKVDIADVRMTLRSVCQKVTLTEQQKLAADVEKDGTVDIADLRKILRFVCDKIEEL